MAELIWQAASTGWRWLASKGGEDGEGWQAAAPAGGGLPLRVARMVKDVQKGTRIGKEPGRTDPAGSFPGWWWWLSSKSGDDGEGWQTASPAGGGGTTRRAPGWNNIRTGKTVRIARNSYIYNNV